MNRPLCVVAWCVAYATKGPFCPAHAPEQPKLIPDEEAREAIARREKVRTLYDLEVKSCPE